MVRRSLHDGTAWRGGIDNARLQGQVAGGSTGRRERQSTPLVAASAKQMADDPGRGCQRFQMGEGRPSSKCKRAEGAAMMLPSTRRAIDVVVRARAGMSRVVGTWEGTRTRT